MLKHPPPSRTFGRGWLLVSTSCLSGHSTRCIGLGQKAARSSIKSCLGGVHLEEIRTAAESLVAWGSESAVGIGRHTETTEVQSVEPVGESLSATPNPKNSRMNPKCTHQVNANNSHPQNALR